ncbi:MAG: hypothetical protein JOY90_24975 [Bradyrhizobium sp.]|uniref:hypothetical protein n=1 Tax=Bradyrhizobium sp. TaxID=376 RepID=UPI001DCA3947|nr:hypothetical protein [Bradyrhizobium sp.]MBV9563667.1 hypothetical protein [Bradyrhizobium sp.]
MTMFSPHSRARDWTRRGHVLPILIATALTAGAIALVLYLLWPTWGVNGSSLPERLPVSVGGTLFNAPTAAIRVKIQRHSGAQERIDLDFSFPSLEPAEAPGEGLKEAPRHANAELAGEATPPIDRIFLSIAANAGAPAPGMLVSSIYPRYLALNEVPVTDGLSMRAFRDGTPYGGEDLFHAATPEFTARCSRDAATPGMCLSQRRIDGADLTFRFPRGWLTQWRDVAGAIQRLTLELHGAR